MDILIGDYIKNQLYKYNELDKQNEETKKLIKFKQLYPHSILSKYLENNKNYLNQNTNSNGRDIYKFYQPIYFPNFNGIDINQSKLEQLTKLCQTLNIWSKSKILIPNSLNKNIKCIEKDFYYYKFNLFGSYYYSNSNKIPKMYIHKYRNHILLNIQDICVFWKNIYLNLYETYNKDTLKQFKKTFKHFIFKSGIIKNINQEMLIQIYFDRMNKKINKFELIENELIGIHLNNYNKVEPYCKRIIDSNNLELNSKIQNSNLIYPKCFNVKESNRFITFEFELLKYL